MKDTTPCIRCGKPRIIAKTWSEKLSGSLVTYTQTVCPDPKCQKIVEREFKKKTDKLIAIQKKSAERRKSMIMMRRLKRQKES